MKRISKGYIDVGTFNGLYLYLSYKKIGGKKYVRPRKK